MHYHRGRFGIADNHRQRGVSHEKAALALERALCHWRGMEPRNMRAGGCFLMAAILIGFVGGIAIRNPLLGTWIGTGVGIAIAVVLWLVDRRNDS